MLSPAELARFSRQIALPEFGTQGQERLSRARVLIVGAGGLGSPAALYLAGAGIGTLGLADDDDVHPSNLHRQLLHGTADVGRAKTESARDSIRRLNPDCDVRLHTLRFAAGNARDLIRQYDLVVDGSDNYPTRYAVNDACAEIGVPWVYGSVERFSGQIAFFDAPDGACYRCVFPKAPAPGESQSCEQLGVLGPVPGIIGSMQALEALKWLAGIGETLRHRLLQFDFATGATQIVQFAQRPDCPACGRDVARVGRKEMHSGHKETAGREGDRNETDTIEPHDVARLPAGAVDLVDVRERWEWEIGRLPGATHIPLGELPAHVHAMKSGRSVVVYCHHGVRSAAAVQWLRSVGIPAMNLAGGIDRWSREVDPTIARY